MLGGIKIVRESSRHTIERKLKELEEQKNQGNITLEEYDTLRIRYERKLGNKEAVSKLQKSKGFKSSSIKEKKAKKEELYDEFVDKYSASEGKDYGEIERSNLYGKTTKRALIVLFILLAFGIGIMAGISAINNMHHEEITPNVTITDSAFSANATITQSPNIIQDTSNVTYNVTKKKKTTKTTKKSYTKNTTSSSSSKSDSSSSSSGSGSNSGSGSSSSTSTKQKTNSSRG